LKAWEGKGNRDQPVDEVMESGRLMGKKAHRITIFGNISGGGFLVNAVVLVIILDVNEQTQKIDFNTTNLYKEHSGRGLLIKTRKPVISSLGLTQTHKTSST